MKVKEYNDVVMKYSNRVCRFVDKMLINRDAAKDLTQEAFLKLWENKDKVDPAKAHSWLFTTAYRLSLEFIRQNKRYDQGSPFPDFGIEPVNPDLQKILQHAFTLLTDQQKSILLLKDYEGYSYEEIGEMLNLNESQVKVYIFRARKRIKDYIKDLNLVL